jgi:STE24 endopeptidase
VIVIWMCRQAAPGARMPMTLYQGATLFVAGLLLVVLFAGLWSRVLARNVRGGNLYRSLQRFQRAMWFSRLLIPVWFAFAIFVLGWGTFVERIMQPINRFPIELPGLILGTLPAFAAWVGLWWAQFPADRALREQNSLVVFEEDLPVHAPPRFWDFFVANLRLQVLFTIVPVTLIILLHDIAAMIFWSTTRMELRSSASGGPDSGVELLIQLGAITLVVLFAPEILRRVLHTESLAPSPLRTRLEELCRRTGLRYSDILLWRTNNVMGNAAVMGLIPQMRYILLSDVLLETMTDQQIEAVFAHEIGHVKHWHMGWYVVIVVTMMLVFSGVDDLLLAVTQHSPDLKWLRGDIYGAVALPCAFAGFLLMFGWLSRRFERQADVYAARTIQRLSSNPDLPERASYVGPAGAELFISALHRVAVINNIPLEPPRPNGTGVLAGVSRISGGIIEHANNYFHGSIPFRMDYLRNLSTAPEKTARFDRFMLKIYTAILLLLALTGGWALISNIA